MPTSWAAITAPSASHSMGASDGPPSVTSGVCRRGERLPLLQLAQLPHILCSDTRALLTKSRCDVVRYGGDSRVRVGGAERRRGGGGGGGRGGARAARGG